MTTIFRNPQKTQSKTNSVKLPIPSLFVIRKHTQYQAPQYGVENYTNLVEPSEEVINYDNELMLDIDGGEALNWNCGFQAYNSYHELEEFIDEEEESNEYFDPTEIRRYCNAMDGIIVSNCEPLEASGGNYVYIDWVECLHYWKETLTPQQLACFDWAILKPSNFVVCADGTVESII